MKWSSASITTSRKRPRLQLWYRIIVKVHLSFDDTRRWPVHIVKHSTQHLMSTIAVVTLCSLWLVEDILEAHSEPLRTSSSALVRPFLLTLPLDLDLLLYRSDWSVSYHEAKVLRHACVNTLARATTMMLWLDEDILHHWFHFWCWRVTKHGVIFAMLHET